MALDAADYQRAEEDLIFFFSSPPRVAAAPAPSSQSCTNRTIGAARTRGRATRRCNTSVQMVDYGHIEPHEGSFDFFPRSLWSCDNYDNWACLIDRYIFFLLPPFFFTPLRNKSTWLDVFGGALLNLQCMNHLAWFVTSGASSGGLEVWQVN